MSAKNKKTLLIVEKSCSDLHKAVDESNGDIILSGVFTSFGVRNRNNRIYESSDFLKQINELQPKIQSHTLLGQLDHPKDFEITLSDVSHVIESLEYDKENNCIVGRIRLLNTSKGKEAKALIQDGIPLHISSRAAGTVNESGIVKCEKLFTYDLVADPGFANAVLTRVNECYGYENDLDTVELYDMNPEVPAPAVTLPVAGTDDTVIAAEPESTSGVKYDDFVAYTNYLSKVISELQAKIVNLEKSKESEGCVKVVDTAEECGENGCEDTVSEEIAACESRIEQLTDYVKYVVENFNKLNLDELKKDMVKHESYMDYISENINKMEKNMDMHEKYMNHIAENINNHEKYFDHIAENINNHEKYFDHIAENVNNHEKYFDHIAENINNHEKYFDHIVENVNSNSDLEQIRESLTTVEEYLADNMTAVRNMTADNDQKDAFLATLVEKVENSIRYTQFIAEELENKHKAVVEQLGYEHNNIKQLDESIKSGVNGKAINENKPSSTSIKSDVRMAAVDINSVNSLSRATDSILEEINKYTESNNKLIAMNEAKLAAAKEQAERITKDNCDKGLLAFVPAELKESVNALSPLELNGLLESAKYYKLVSDEDKVNFWRSRDLKAPAKFNTNSADETVKKIDEDAKPQGYSDKQLELLKQQSKNLRNRLGLTY